MATERLAMTSSGDLRYALKTPYRDGITQIVIEPLDLMARLAALVPPPRMHLTRFHGVFAPHSKLRGAVTQAHRGIGSPQPPPAADPAWPRTPHHVALSWAGQRGGSAMNLLTILILLALGATIVSLVLGLYSMERGGEYDRVHSMRHMAARVTFQGVTLILLLIALVYARAQADPLPRPGASNRAGWTAAGGEKPSVSGGTPGQPGSQARNPAAAADPRGTQAIEQQRQVSEASQRRALRMPHREPADAGAGGEEPERHEITPPPPRQDGRRQCEDGNRQAEELE